MPYNQLTSNRFYFSTVEGELDVWTLSAVAGLVDEICTVNPDLQALVFLNRADPRGSDNDDAVPARPVPITRDAWILEALHEKATREFG